MTLPLPADRDFPGPDFPDRDFQGETAPYSSLDGKLPRKMRFLEPLEIQKRVALAASAGRCFLDLVYHLSRDGLKPGKIDIPNRKVSFIRPCGPLSVACHVGLVGIARDKAILTVVVERPLLTRLFVEKAWYTHVLHEAVARVDKAIERR